MLLLLVGGYLLFNYSFMLIRPVGIPVGEIVLVLSLLMINHQKVLPRFIHSPIFIPFAIWLGFGLCGIITGIFDHGIWAIRDGSHVIESMFLYVGFAFAGSPHGLQKIQKVLPPAFLCLIFYGLLFPFRDLLSGFIPTVQNLSGKEFPLLMHGNTAMLFIVISAYFTHLYFARPNRHRYIVVAIFLIATSLILLPSRTLYLQIIFMLVYFMFSGGVKQLKKVALLSIMPIILIAIIMGSGLSIYGRFDFELIDYFKHFMEIFQFGNTDKEMISSGNDLRILWWTTILMDWASSWVTILFGRGFGFPLVDMTLAGDVAVREPHNDIIGILARMGIIATLSFLIIQTYLIYASLKVIDCFKSNVGLSSLCVSLLMLIICTLIITLGESPFIMSFFAIPYYFGAGIILRLNRVRSYIGNLNTTNQRATALQQLAELSNPAALEKPDQPQKHAAYASR